MERRIYYDEVEGMTVEWLEATSTLVLNLFAHKRSFRRGGTGNFRPLEDVALLVRPYDLKQEQDVFGKCITRNVVNADTTCKYLGPTSNYVVDPEVFPLTLHILSTIPVALHAVGGDDGPLGIGVRLYMSSYLR